jgi:uncharacterized protein (DUF2147 family)
MKKIIILKIICVLLAANNFAQSKISSNSINGIYWSPKKDAKIEIFQKGAFYYGKTIWVATAGKDKNNPTKSLRQRDLLGLELLSNFSFDDGTYVDGEVYDPATGKTYDCKMTPEGNRLKVRGYVGISLFGRTEYFERIK